jgi:regulator of nucleoside diphosphate kinase
MVREDRANVMSDIHFDTLMQRPPIVLTTKDCNRISGLIGTRSEIDPDIARFLREEIDRATIVCGDVATASFVTMGSEVKFIDHDSVSIRRIKLVYPDDANSSSRISVLTPIGGALIGLGPGQSISWSEDGVGRRLTVLEVQPASE